MATTQKVRRTRLVPGVLPGERKQQSVFEDGREVSDLLSRREQERQALWRVLEFDKEQAMAICVAKQDAGSQLACGDFHFLGTSEPSFEGACVSTILRLLHVW